MAPGQPLDANGPVFAEPWQAHTFALAVRLYQAGCFTWPEWCAALGTELEAAARDGAPEDGSRYYEHWQAALGRLIAAKGVLGPQTLHERKTAWARAYRATPHGQPVTLQASAEDPQA